ncbi:MAG: multidrug transporter [Methanomassiliicoccus sp.]|nr:MAG: multidrug transporter [Methanomassiliicoccus sp.]
MSETKDYSKKSFIVVGTHGDEDVERATMAFACAGASSALGIKTKVFLTGSGVKLVQKGFAEKLKSVEGMAPVKQMIDAFVKNGGKVQVCIPCLESRGIDKKAFIEGVEFINLMDFAAEAADADRVFTC